MKRITHRQPAVIAAIVLQLALMPLAGCATTHGPNSNSQTGQTAAATPPEPSPSPPSQPPPVDLAGKWKLSAVGGAACLVTFGANTGAAEGTVAPGGGCPGNFFTSRKWTFEHDKLILRDHKGQELIELSFADGRFQGQAASGGTITLAR